jgi:hypothetical protein
VRPFTHVLSGSISRICQTPTFLPDLASSFSLASISLPMNGANILPEDIFPEGRSVRIRLDHGVDAAWGGPSLGHLLVQMMVGYDADENLPVDAMICHDLRTNTSRFKISASRMGYATILRSNPLTICMVFASFPSTRRGWLAGKSLACTRSR